MNRWIRWLIKSSQVYGELPELVKDVNNSNNPVQALNSYFSQEEIEDIKQLRQRLEDKKESLDELETIISNVRTRNGELTKRIENLEDRFLHQNEQKKYWNNKHPKRDVRYTRPIYISPGNWREYPVPVTDFIMPYDFEIQNRVDNLQVDNPMAIDRIVPKIYREARENYSYEYDSKSLGMSEFWKFPPETMCSHGDCEDWSHVIASFLIAGGVPSWRVRVTYGMINSGNGGHSTVYVLDDNMETWRHLNSTSPSYSYDNLSDYPIFGDGSDDMGIDPDKVWGSFNDRHAWQIFETNDSEQSYDEHKLSKQIRVE